MVLLGDRASCGGGETLSPGSLPRDDETFKLPGSLASDDETFKLPGILARDGETSKLPGSIASDETFELPSTSLGRGGIFGCRVRSKEGRRSSRDRCSVKCSLEAARRRAAVPPRRRSSC